MKIHLLALVGTISALPCRPSLCFDRTLCRFNWPGDGIRPDKSSASQTTRVAEPTWQSQRSVSCNLANDECVILSDRDISSGLPMAMQRAAR
jgi:hypothetical protein